MSGTRLTGDGRRRLGCYRPGYTCVTEVGLPAPLQVFGAAYRALDESLPTTHARSNYAELPLSRRQGELY